MSIFLNRYFGSFEFKPIESYDDRSYFETLKNRLKRSILENVMADINKSPDRCDKVIDYILEQTNDNGRMVILYTGIAIGYIYEQEENADEKIIYLAGFEPYSRMITTF